MRITDIIRKKKHGMPLTTEEIQFFVFGYTEGRIPDYQISALLMAIYFKGMEGREIADLTDAMVRSGDQVDLSAIEGIKVDKHSTGGVGDKISLIVIPLVAALGIPVAKMSGRGLGHTGGTIDKLEAIEGFKVELDNAQFIENVNRYKMAIVGQSGNLTPADKKLYALRDVTETVDSIPLIASSIMSKKIASGSDAIVLDVKVGSGAFMKSLDQARELARTMVSIGESLGRKTRAVLTNMDQPLGHEVGNANEVREAIEVLRGEGAEDETEVALAIAAQMAVLGGACADTTQARRRLEAAIQSGEALAHLRTFIEIQGGDPGVVDHPDRLPTASHHVEVRSERAGYVTGFDTEQIGLAAMLLGAGRQKKEDAIDFAAGVTLVKKIGDAVETGDVLCRLHTNLTQTQEAERRIHQAFVIGPERPEPVVHVYEVIEGS